MPRKRKADQEGRFAKNRLHRNQWPLSSVWGGRRDLVTGETEHAAMEVATDRWFARHQCDRSCDTCGDYARVSRLRRMYRGRR